ITSVNSYGCEFLFRSTIGIPISYCLHIPDYRGSRPLGLSSCTSLTLLSLIVKKVKMALVKQEVEEVNLSSATALIRPEQTNDSLDTFIRQAIGKEPFLSFSRTGDSPIQWIQLLHALDQQDLPGWPLFSPVKIQLQKCEKCSLEFCSTINYRRHIRLHRRALNLDRDFTIRNREFLRAFWDKLSSEEAMEIVSFTDVFLEEVPGSSIIKALTLFIRRPGFSSLPPAYMKAGAALLDIIQARSSRFPVMYQELFSILDDASEKTFLCAGKAESLQKFVFDGEAGKIGLEMRNLVACTSFLIEQKLVKAWLADKDAESLRYQKLLVEEEEAAQKRQADLLERKRLKKLRQKEQKAKTPTNGKDSADTSDGGVPSPSASSPRDPFDSTSQIPDFLQDPIPLSFESNTRLIKERNGNSLDTGCSEGNGQIIENKVLLRDDHVHTNTSRWHAHKLQRGSDGFHVGQNHQVAKLGTSQKRIFNRDSRNSTSLNNANKVWTPKPKLENDEESCRTQLQVEETRAADQAKNMEVLIGSISVAIGNCKEEPLGTLCSSDIEPPISKCNIQNKPTKPDNHSVKLWRPVSRQENGDRAPIQKATPYDSVNGIQDNTVQVTEDGQHLRFSSCAAEAFLAQRWKEAIASDHIELVVLPETNPPKFSEIQKECSLNHDKENQVRVACAGATEIKSKYRPQFEVASKVRYIPKQRSVT
ncbi:hypothetical protein V2J09_011247, partial [Rumex salicifolius]